MTPPLPDDLEVIVPGIDYVPERMGERPTMTVVSAGLGWSFYRNRESERWSIINEGTSWNEPCDFCRMERPFPLVHVTSASSISRAFIPEALFPYIEALLKLHA